MLIKPFPRTCVLVHYENIVNVTHFVTLAVFPAVALFVPHEDAVYTQTIDCGKDANGICPGASRSGSGEVNLPSSRNALFGNK